jgi:hypothetical protein
MPQSTHTECCAAAVLIRIRSNTTYTNSQKAARAFFCGARVEEDQERVQLSAFTPMPPSLPFCSLSPYYTRHAG